MTQCEECGVLAKDYPFAFITTADNFRYCEECWDPEEPEPNETEAMTRAVEYFRAKAWCWIVRMR